MQAESGLNSGSFVMHCLWLAMALWRLGDLRIVLSASSSAERYMFR
jgi:hypothetical protein